ISNREPEGRKWMRACEASISKLRDSKPLNGSVRLKKDTTRSGCATGSLLFPSRIPSDSVYLALPFPYTI
ncbi:hypothetical protein, partial [Oceanidesulfovibrio marinus]|uniref:hypothetical protein n=1 Tax=Oceanidesulfovibrio marinus TaxID=370038 RepID=UPI001ABF4F7F